jgi:hypothetical protein
VQAFQILAQNQLFEPALQDGRARIDPTPIRLVARTPLLGRLAARMVGLGVRMERVRSPAA